MDRLLEFIRDNHAWWARQPPDSLAAYLAWHHHRDLLAASFVGDDPFAVCTVRFLVRLEDWLNPWVWHPEGAIAMVDLLVSASPLAQADCFEALVRRWGSRPVVLWERGDRTIESTRAPRIFRWDQFMRLARRMTYGAIDGEKTEMRKD